MENPGFQSDEADIEALPPPTVTPPPPDITSEDVVPKSKKSKKRNSVVFIVEEEKVTTNNAVVEEGSSIVVGKIPSRKLSLIQKLHPELNLSPLIELMGNTISFHLTTKYLACYPTMTLVPLQYISSIQTQSSTGSQPPAELGNGASSPASPTMIGYEILVRSQNPCNWALCCCPSSLNSQMVSVSRGDNPEDKVLSFIYAPHIWCPASHQERLVDIFMPGVNERMGWIEAGRDVGIGSEIVCGLTKEVFITRQMEEKGCPRGFKIENAAGLEVANGKVTTSAWMGSWGPVSRWMGFSFNFVPSEVDTLSHPTRAVLLAAFLLWVIDAREKRQWQYIWTILFILFLIACFLFIKFFGPNE